MPLLHSVSPNTRRLGAAIFALFCSTLALQAAPIEVRFTAVLTGDVSVSEAAEPVGALSWSAMPLDLPEDSDALAALIFTPEPVLGDWQLQLEPGPYTISGYSARNIFEAEVMIAAEGPRAFSIAEVVPDSNIAFQCTGESACDWGDAVSGLTVRLPAGWSSERPYHAELETGQLAEPLTAVFFEDLDGSGAAVWFLNPLDWMEADNGPCREVSLGALCTFEISDQAERAFAIIAPSLKQVKSQN